MEQMLAGLAALIRHFLITRNNGVANCTFGLALESSDDVSAESVEAVSYGAVLWVDVRKWSVRKEGVYLQKM